MIDEKRSLVRGAAILGLLVLLTACAPQTGGGTETTDETSQSGDEETTDNADGDSGGDSGGNGIVDVCALAPDAALEAALGSPPGERELYRSGSETTCAIYGTGAESSLVQLSYIALGRDAFEVNRSYVEGSEGLYFEVDGLGEDAFRFGNDVTALQGPHIVSAYLEGLAFDFVPDEERLARTIALLQAAIANLP